MGAYKGDAVTGTEPRTGDGKTRSAVAGTDADQSEIRPGKGIE